MSLKAKYLYNGGIFDEDTLHHNGIIISDTEPVTTTVYGLGSYDGQTAIRHIGSNGDCIVKTATAIVYYATQSECDIDWTTEEPLYIGHTMYILSAASVQSVNIGSPIILTKDEV